MRKLIAVAVAGLIFASVFAGGADARPKYKSEFEKKYPKVKENNKITCAACHPEKSKKVKNDYGTALGKVIAKNEKDAGKIGEALGKIEKEKSSVDGKTFGDLLKEGKLPGDK
ncbi:MAG: hypothetical protein ACYTGL_22290 [Planctomycetota bacterium]|jgi:hypothetical protein